ncbi:MAG: DNA repair protein RadC [Chitinophagales bacterium]
MEPENQSSIKMWSVDDRPREKFLQKGRAALSDAELIAILFGSGGTSGSALDLARRLLQRVDHNLIELSRQHVSDLKKVQGIGDAKAVALLAALELGRRRRGAEPSKRVFLRSSTDFFEFLQTFLSDLQHEEFVVVFLNRRLALLGYHRLSVGGQSGTVADVKLIVKLAIERMAASIVVAHNHPSGTLHPSDADIALTKNIVQACACVDIVVNDHLIVAENSYFSFADQGLL